MTKKLTEKVYKQISEISREIVEDFRKKGIVIPSKLPNGNIRLDRFLIVKNPDGFYSVKNILGEAIVEKINLPQTAILLANGLALGKFLDTNLLAEDRKYGYATFEESVHKNSITRNKSVDKITLSMAKMSACKAKKESSKRTIMKSFEKLSKIA